MTMMEVSVSAPDVALINREGTIALLLVYNRILLLLLENTHSKIVHYLDRLIFQILLVVSKNQHSLIVPHLNRLVFQLG